MNRGFVLKSEPVKSLERIRERLKIRSRNVVALPSWIQPRVPPLPMRHEIEVGKLNCFRVRIGRIPWPQKNYVCSNELDRHGLSVIKNFVKLA